MFGKKKKVENSGKVPMTKKANSAAPINALNSLVQGTSVEGDIKSESDIRIDGVIKGTLTCNAKVIIGPTGFVEGDVNCKNAMIEGRFEGTINVSELLNVRETAEVNGEIFTNKLIVQSGAIFNVGCKMGTQYENEVGGKPKAATKEIGGDSQQKANKKAS